ncbi:MAG: Polysaccharide deacetylase [Solirubrobacterales bacterium]|nr:Polysaccharide deacetylase [Solirubrobacterales bacterium]
MPPALTVALYHHFSDEPGPWVDHLAITTPPALFEQHLDRLERDYEIVDLDRVIDGAPLPRRALLLTFDDGYRSVVDVAGPVLTRRGLPSVFFLSDAFLGNRLVLDNLLCRISHDRDAGEIGAAIGPGRRCTTVAGLVGRVAEQSYARRLALPAELRERFEVEAGAEAADAGRLLLGPDDVAGLAGAGMAVGNHTRSHVHCRTLTDPEHAERELTSYRTELEQLAGTPVRAFSYPYGQRADATPFVERVLAAGGHEATFLVGARSNRWRTGGPWSRVSFQAQPVAGLHRHLRHAPLARAVRDRVRGVR